MTATLQTPNLAAYDLPVDSDPLLKHQEFAHRATFYPLGFPIEIETNDTEVLLAAHESWDELGCEFSAPKIRIRLGVRQSDATECPPGPTVRAHGHLLSIIADAENFIVCDLRQSSAFGWINSAALQNRRYLRYHFVEAVALVLLSTSRVVPIHAACVSFAGHGFLFCGESGAGKSTLAYACARAGWTYTSDDASYLLWHGADSRVHGNAHQLRFRPSAKQLFPEIKGRMLTPRAEGKPSIEVATADLPGIVTSRSAIVRSIVVLDRRALTSPELIVLTRERAWAYFENSLYASAEIQKPQINALQRLLSADTYRLQYSGLQDAIQCLEQLTGRERE